MKLLVGRTLRLPRQLTTRPGLCAAWILGVTALEVLGRRFREETVDLLGQTLLLVLLMTTLAVHLHQPLEWLSALTERARRLARSAWRAVPDFALDLRETPPLPRAVPPALYRALVALAIAACGLLLAARHLPGTLRAVLAPISYTVWVALLLGVYAALALGIALTTLHSARHVRRAARLLVVRRMPRVGGQSTGATASGVWVLALLAASLWAPGIVPLAAIAVLCVLAVLALHLPGNGRMTLIWRPAGAGGEPRALGARSALSLQLALFALLLIDLGLLAAGQSIGLGLGSESPTGHTVTTWLGRLFLWAACGSGLVGAVQLVRVLRLSRCLRTRPADSQTVFIEGELARVKGRAAPRKQLSARLAAAQWRARFPPALPRTTDVRVRVSLGSMAPDDRDPFAQGDLFTRWPITLSPEALSDDASLARLARRRVVLLRRHLAKGFRRLFKQGQLARKRTGNGVWIGLQHWFHVGMTRDAEGDTDGDERSVGEPILGPPYHRVFLRAARLHYAEVLRALEVDLIFVEDGLGFRRFRRALGVLFETFDIHAGALRVEERHFVGLPGTRAVLHELSPDRPFPKPGPGYPEPDYENIGRARILHLFKDRGGEEACAPAPVDLTDLPVPVLVG